MIFFEGACYYVTFIPCPPRSLTAARYDVGVIIILGRAHREKFYRECIETEHTYSVKDSVKDDDFILDKMYHIPKL